MITNASFASSGVDKAPQSPPRASLKDELPTRPTSFYLFPSFKHVTIPAPEDSKEYASYLDSLVQDYVIRSSEDIGSTPEEHSINLEQLAEWQAISKDLNAQLVNEVVVLICGHGGRDSRCGALGLPLQQEFEDKLKHASIEILPKGRSVDRTAPARAGHVGLISHIGGHKWAGNVIIYIPATWDAKAEHNLNGSAIWYGRVEPKHVEGIVQETVLEGRIIKDLWRGGMKLSETPNGRAWKPIQPEQDP